MRGVVSLACILFILGCGKDSENSVEPGNISVFNVVNESNQTLVVWSDPSRESSLVEPGGEILIDRSFGGGYVDFELPSEILTCVSAFDATGESLVFQHYPVNDTAWIAVQGAVRVMHFTFVIEDSMLSEDGNESQCR